MKINEFVVGSRKQLTEDIITFGGKLYPKFGQVVILAGGAGCHAKGEKILKFDMTQVNAEDVMVGDVLMGDDGTPRTVLKLHRGNAEMIKLHIPGKQPAIFNRGHIFSVLVDNQVIDLTFDEITTSLTHGNTPKMFFFEHRFPAFKPVFEILPSDDYYGFEVDGNHRYVMGNFLVTHNSGKGFVKDTLLGIEGIVFDVDRLKELLVASMRFNAKVKEEFGVDLKQIDFKNTQDVSTLHEIVSILNIPDKKTEAVIRSVLVADPSRKPNLIFDVTLKDLTKFFNIIRQVQQMGYVKKNVSLVWILNELEIALQQNAKRARTVAPEILISTHKGASYTMTEILSMGEDLSQYMDGDIWLVFNKAKVDSDVEKGTPAPSKVFKNTKIGAEGGMYIKSANYVQLKKQSGQVVDISKLTADVVSKIKKYVPNPEVWDAAAK